MFGRGIGHNPPRMFEAALGTANVHKFTTHSFRWPLNLGIQAPLWNAGGPSGFQNGTAGAIKPWPYITGTKQFISGGMYGAASTLVSRPNGPNLGSGNVKFLNIGVVKNQTYTNKAF